MSQITITVYGAEQVCASCVGAPNAKDTYEWLQAAVGRKYSTDSVTFEYIDIEQPPNIEKHHSFIKRIIQGDLFYPLVLVNDKVVAEGIPRLKPIYRELDKNNLPLRAEEK